MWKIFLNKKKNYKAALKIDYNFQIYVKLDSRIYCIYNRSKCVYGKIIFVNFFYYLAYFCYYS